MKKYNIVYLYSLIIMFIIPTNAQNDIKLLSVDSPKSGNQASIGEKTIFYPTFDIKGKFIYINDTSIRKGNYTPYPWENYIVIKKFDVTEKNNLDQQKINIENISSYQIHNKVGDYLIQPVFSPDGKSIVFKSGDRSSEYGTFTLHIFNLETKELTIVGTQNKCIYYWPVLWSPNNKYLGYFQNGNPLPFGGEYPLELWVYDIKLKKNIFIAQHDNITNNINWTPDNKLIYSLPPDSKKMAQGILASLFEFDPSINNQKPVKIGEDAIYPTPSPNGKWIATFSNGQEGLKSSKMKKIAKVTQRKLKLFSTNGDKPIIVDNNIDSYNTFLRWSNDSEHLYIISKSFKDDNNILLTVYNYNVKKAENRIVSTFSCKTQPYENLNLSQPNFLPLKVSKNNKYLYFTNSEISNQKYNGFDFNYRYLKIINLSDGKISNICRVVSFGYLDWYDESENADENK